MSLPAPTAVTLPAPYAVPLPVPTAVPLSVPSAVPFPVSTVIPIPGADPGTDPVTLLGLRRRDDDLSAQKYDSGGDGWQSAVYALHHVVKPKIEQRHLQDFETAVDAPTAGHHTYDDDGYFRRLEDGDPWARFEYGADDLTIEPPIMPTSVVVTSGTLAGGSEGFVWLCLADGCYELTVGGGSVDSEIGFEFLDEVRILDYVVLVIAS